MEKEKEQNIFSIFYYTATPNEKKLIIAVCLLSGFFSSGFVGLSVWFQDPHFICQSGSEHHHCTAAEICSSTSNMTANTKSLVYELSLYCEKHSQKIWLLTCTFIGGLFGSLLNLIVHISSEKRKSFLSFLGLIFSFSNFAIFFFIQNETIVAISLMVMMYPVMVGSSYAFTVINEYFSGDLAKASSVFLTLSRGLFGISFGIFCYIINSSAKTLFLTTGCLTFVFSSYLFFYENEKGIKERMTKAVKILFFSFHFI